MTILQKQALDFFQRDLLQEINQQIRIFESQPTSSNLELGRIRLYDERSKISTHFSLCSEEAAAYLTNHLSHAILGRVRGEKTSNSLSWQEKESVRHSLENQHHLDLLWDNPNLPPNALLTKEGEIKKQ